MPLVFVVDDEHGILFSPGAFSKAGYVVAEAPNGSIGYQLCCGLHPDIAIVDLFMPEKEGIETILEIRGMRPRPLNGFEYRARRHDGVSLGQSSCRAG